MPLTANMLPYSAMKKIRPAEAAVLGVEAGDQFALGLGEVERGALATGRGAGEEDEERDERERVVEDVPVPEPADLLVRPMVLRFSVPATMTGTSTHIARGTS